ncbi:MAG TPA: cytochrome c [Mycobacteriales bacterium]|jgi:mono/diheme cytochrome c family protein|nr:cytochrome c [Mycobacteriales bacterium]
MSARHRRARDGASSAAPQPGVEAPAATRSPRRWRRRLAWVAAAVGSSAVALVGLLIVGERYGANPAIGDRPAFGATGMEIYQRNCAVCHGPAGEGGTGPAFTPGGPLSALSFEDRVKFIGDPRSGLNIMPAWERRGMSRRELEMVAAYTQVLSGQQPQAGVEAVR